MNISFFGLGYVGCVGMGCLAQNGHKIIGVDISPEKIKNINFKLFVNIVLKPEGYLQ